FDTGCRPHRVGSIQERSSANDMVLPFRDRALRIQFGRFSIVIALIPISAEFANVTEHVVQPDGVGLETPYGRSKTETIIPQLNLGRGRISAVFFDRGGVPALGE